LAWLISRYEHPYKEEIESYTYPEDMYTVREPASYTALEESTATFVDTEEALDEMLRELKQARVIAIDLEHHDLRSYAGIVCLMQISTRDRDWIVDTLRPWRRRLQKLNEVFADPGIVKVLHGAQWDVIWLQRDFGLYLVGLFDTYHASRALRLQAGNLAFLLKKYCGFDAQKQYQLADWRQRPLPQPLLDYARSDTHFLLYIYDCLCNELVEGSTPAQDGDLVANVLRNSKDTALARHRAEPYDARFGLGPHGWYRALARHPALFTRQQFATFRALHAWRDAVAREDDDSPTLVLSQHALFAMAREPPATRAAVLRLSAAPVTSAAVRSRAGEIVAVVERAVAGAEEGGDMLVAMRESRERERALRARAAGQEEDEGPAAAVAAGKNDAPADVPLARPGAARLLSSVFWGALLTRPQRRGFSSSPEAAATAAVRLALPLPALTAEVFAPAERADEGPAADGAAPAAAPRFVPQDQRCGDDFAEGLDDVFVVRQLGENRRKRARAEAAVHERDDGGGLAPVDEAEAARRAERRAARKAARREKKASTAADVEAAADEEEQAEEGAFDYEAAPSLVKGGAAGEDGVGGGFGVYKRAMDAPRGLPKRKERLGKSKTFGR
jgi:exosome complex exonuclease RRP6